MIRAFRFDRQIVLEVESSSVFEEALLASASLHGIGLAQLPAESTDCSRYRLSRPNECRFGQYLGVVFRPWPRRKNEHRVLAELRRMDGNSFVCKNTERRINLKAPYDSAAKVRCGLHAGTYGWRSPECSSET